VSVALAPNRRGLIPGAASPYNEPVDTRYEARGTSDSKSKAPRWMAVVLALAGVYNLMWGTMVVLLPGGTFSVGGLERPGVPLNYPEVWQCLGMVVGVYGVGYLAAARDPYRHWPVVLVGLLGKLFGPVGALDAVFRKGTMSAAMLWTHLTNDLVRLPFFAVILDNARRAASHADV
jgi:small multidrug resistance pump